MLCRAASCYALPDIIPPLNALGFWDTFRAWSLGLAQCLPKGRLLKYDPRTKEAHVVAKVSAVLAVQYVGSTAVHHVNPKPPGPTLAVQQHKLWLVVTYEVV